MIVLILLFLTGPIADLPKAVLGATIIRRWGCRLGVAELRATEWSCDRGYDRRVVVTGARIFAVGLSIVDVVRRSARPHDAVLGWVPELGRYGDVAVHRDAQVTPGVTVYRLDDRLFFANAGYFKARVHEAIRGASTPTRWVVFDAEATVHIDSGGLAALDRARRRAAPRGPHPPRGPHEVRDPPAARRGRRDRRHRRRALPSHGPGRGRRLRGGPAARLRAQSS